MPNLNPASLAARLVLVAALSLTAASLAGAAGAADPDPVAAARAALQQAVNSGRPSAMLAAKAQFVALANGSPDDARLHYWVALADWRIVPLLSGRKETAPQAEKLCDEGLARCKRALELDPKFAEAMALQVGLQGMSIQFAPSRAMSLGMGMEQTIARARELAPANPRVVLFDAINTLYKPSFVGGGADKASPKFGRAIELFAKEAPATDPAAPDWGRDDGFLWAGQCAARAGDHATARDFYLKALEANPDNAWVKSSLLPGAEKALAAEKGGS
jgi:tetratricopeptide (TPR) repeat protein